MLPDYFGAPQRDVVLLHDQSHSRKDSILLMSMWDDDENNYRGNE